MRPARSRARIETWITGLALPEGYPLGMRISTHYGAVVLSRLGADTHQHITATGDIVNVASRLLEVELASIAFPYAPTSHS